MPADTEDSSHIKHASSNSETDSESTTTSTLSLPDPPDGGWGWLVVFASFMIHLIADGCAFSFGVMYVELLDYFKESKGKTAWVGSLFVSVPLITGPIASALTNRYGCRRTTIVGGLIAGIGFIASSFADSIEQLCFTFGIISGIGLSMVYVPAVVIVAYYFEEKRAFATGIAVAGSGIGTFVFAPFTEYLIGLYSWRGTVLIIGGIMLNIIVCGALFRPLGDLEESERKRHQHSRETFPRNSSRHDFIEEYKHCNEHLTADAKLLILLQELEEPVAHSLMQFPTYLQKELTVVAPDLLKDLRKNGKTLHEVLDSDLIEKYYASSRTNITEEDEMSQVERAGLNNIQAETSGLNDPQTDTSGINGVIIKIEQKDEDHRANADDVVQGQDNGDIFLLPEYKHSDINAIKSHHRDLVWQKQSRHRLIRNRISDQNWPMYRKDIFYRGSLAQRAGITSPKKRAASCPDIMMQANDSSSDDLSERMWLFKLLRFSKEVKMVMKEMLDMAILRSIIFVYFCISSMLLYMWYDVPYVYSPDKAISMGISEEMASFLVSILGIVSTVGQIVIGYIGDRPGINTLQLYSALTTVAGVATLLVPLFSTFLGLAIYSGAFGFFISANYALTTIILVDLLGMEKLTNAYGLVMLAEGISNLIGPPLAGKTM